MPAFIKMFDSKKLKLTQIEGWGGGVGIVSNKGN